MKTRLSILLSTKFLEYYPWYKITDGTTTSRSLLLDNYVFSQLAKIIYTMSYESGDIDVVCEEKYGDPNITPFILFLNGLSSHFNVPATIGYPTLDVLTEVLLKQDPTPRRIEVAALPTLRDELGKGLGFSYRKYGDISWLLNIMKEVRE